MEFTEQQIQSLIDHLRGSSKSLDQGIEDVLGE